MHLVCQVADRALSGRQAGHGPQERGWPPCGLSEGYGHEGLPSSWGSISGGEGHQQEPPASTPLPVLQLSFVNNGSFSNTHSPGLLGEASLLLTTKSGLREGLIYLVSALPQGAFQALWAH